MITDIEDYFTKGCGRCERFATADCSTRLIATGLGTRNTPGVGSNFLRAAFDTYQNGVIGCDASAISSTSSIHFTGTPALRLTAASRTM